MPAYNATKPAALAQGESIALVNDATTDTGVTKSQQVNIGPVPGSGSAQVLIVNSTNQTAVGQVAQADADANYQPMTSISVATDTAVTVQLPPCFVRFTFGSAPTSGSVVVSM